jgi:transcriptional regulator with XRE-family HTH domain
MSISPEQLKVARAQLRWTQAYLAAKAGVSESIVSAFERGARRPLPWRVTAIRRALETAGIEFTSGRAGVALRDEKVGP